MPLSRRLAALASPRFQWFHMVPSLFLIHTTVNAGQRQGVMLQSSGTQATMCPQTFLQSGSGWEVEVHSILAELRAGPRVTARKCGLTVARKQRTPIFMNTRNLCHKSYRNSHDYRAPV